MMTAAVEPVFIDTNILVYSSVDTAPLYTQARAAIAAYEGAGTPLWISRQVLREYLATLARPKLGIPMTELTTTVRQYEVRFQVAEDGPLTTVNLLNLLDQGYSTQIHDTNIVATMQMIGVRHILTNNPDDFTPFTGLITVIPLVGALTTKL
jgi:predicted nucleic acid-binding protein